LKIINNLNHDAYILNTFNDSLDNYAGWDTAIFDQLYVARSNSIYNLQGKPSSWRSYIKNSPQGKMKIYVIPVDSVKLHGWKYIFNNYSKLNPIEIDMSDLRKNNWEITLK
jgi:hypothetical protein